MILSVETSVVIGFAIFLLLTIIAVTLIAKRVEKKSSKTIHAFEALTLTDIGKKEKEEEENKKRAERTRSTRKSKRPKTDKRKKSETKRKKKSPGSLEFNQELKLTESTIEEVKPQPQLDFKPQSKSQLKPQSQVDPAATTKSLDRSTALKHMSPEQTSSRINYKPDKPVSESDSMVISVMEDREVSLEDTACNLRAINDDLVYQGFAASPARDTDKYESQMYDATEAMEKWLEIQKKTSSTQIPVFNGKFDPNLEESADTLGDTAQKISELDTLFQEIDRIVDFISPKDTEEEASAHSLSEEFQKKVQESFQQKGLSNQEFSKILNGLDIPAIPNEKITQDEQNLPKDSDESSPKGTPESIEKWKKMLGF